MWLRSNHIVLISRMQLRHKGMLMTILPRNLVFVLGLFLLAPLASAAQGPTDVSFSTADGGMVDADLYGVGSRGVVFAHGAIFNKQSWAPLARRIAAHGLRALAIDFRGYGKSRSGSDPNALDQDVIAAVRWLHKQGVEKVSLVGGSMGGGASGKAATEVKPGEIDKLVLLSPMPIDNPEALKAASILYIASRNEGLAPTVRAQFKRAPEPKKLILLNGSAHAQNIFDTDQAQNLSDDIVQFLVGGK
jgi:pimeloyl-ACP methyl ester carboxylesterase